MGRSQDIQCTTCGAELTADADNCWLCSQAVSTSVGERAVAPAPVKRLRKYSLATLMLVVTGICVWLGVTVQWPWAGVVVAVLAVPAAARAWWYQQAWHKAGEPLTPVQAALSFLGSLVVVILIVGAGLFALATAGHVAFVATCSPLEKTTLGTGLIRTWVLGVAPALGLFIGGMLLWRLWIRQVRQRRQFGRPPIAKERVLQFVHAILTATCTLAAASVSAFPLLWKLRESKIHYDHPRDAEFVWPLVWVAALAAFLTSGTLAFWFSRRNLRLAGQIAAMCGGGWLGAAIGDSYWPRERISTGAMPFGQFMLLSMTLCYLLPLALGAAAYWLYGLAVRAVRWWNSTAEA